jgi:ribosome-binding protein aMBF1 (putative translation factor)
MTKGKVMDAIKKKNLEAKGWHFGNAADFLGLDDKEQEFVEIRLALARRMKEERRTKKISQQAVADRISSSQSRVAKMEAADRSVSIDLLIRSLVGIGVSRVEIGEAIAGKQAQ